MIAPVYGSWCSYQTAESGAVTKDRAALGNLMWFTLAVSSEKRRKYVAAAWRAIPEASVLCEFADSGTI
jgi:hypothetical protein